MIHYLKYICGFLIAWVLCTREFTLDVQAQEPDPFFVEKVLPIFEMHCLSCHSHQAGKSKGGLVLDSRSGWQVGGTEGPAVIPHKPDESLLVSAIRYQGYQMPPEEKLSDAEIQIIVEWIARGAPDHRETKKPSIDPSKFWALEPISRPDYPETVDADWCLDQADAFVLEKLEKAGLNPAPLAPRNVWLRRVTLDLTGMLPSVAELEGFLNDPADSAYETVVDRLLNSEAFGDHWGRHWLDLSCYADLADIQGDVLVRDAWRYRDYVIDSFNMDKPLDQFIHQQIAGDLLDYQTPQQRRENLVATGFLAIGPWTLQNYIKGQLAADVVDHQIDKIGRVFLGQTLACARCHDHKFDPVPTADYYALAGIFHSTKTTSYDGPGVWSQISHMPLPVTADDQATYDSLVVELAAKKQRLSEDLKKILDRENQTRFTKKVQDDQANAITTIQSIDANTKGVDYLVSFMVGPSVWADPSQATQATDGLVIQILRADGSVLAFHTVAPGAWTSKEDSQSFSLASFQYVGDGTGAVFLHIAPMAYTGRFGGAIDDLSIRIASEERALFSDDFSNWKLGDVQGSQAHTSRSVYAKCTSSNWTGAGTNHSHAVNHGDKATPNIAIQFYSGSLRNTNHPDAVAIQRELTAIDQRVESARPGSQTALAIVDLPEPADCRIYKRGDFQSLGEIVPRGFVQAIGSSGDLKITQGQSGRVQLAHWLTDPGNPLTARVLVNRIWKELFGQGIVRSVDYFGVHGDQPSHPELLDFLADRMRSEDAWSMKKTIKRLVLSQTYRMSSSHDPKASLIDPENQLLWHMPRRRMSAESIRDSILALSAQLDSGRGGPSLGLQIEGNIAGLGGNVNPPTWVGKIDPLVRHRRSIYLPYKRERPSGELEILSVFDFPHPNDITGQRPNTTVATQALFLINAPLMKEQARKMAEHWLAKVPDNDIQRYEQLVLTAYSRLPDQRVFGESVEEPGVEQTSVLGFLKSCQETYVASGQHDQDQARLSAWAELCHAILGSNEFLFYE